MAIGQESDFKIYQDQFQTGVVETLLQNTDAFNAASQGAISLVTKARRGQYSQQAFFKSISGLVSRRDTTSVSSATDLALTEDEWVSVKVNRKIGPVAQTEDAFRKIMGDATPEEFSMVLGQQSGKAMQVDMLDTGLVCARAALANQSANLFTVASSGTMTTQSLVSGLAKFGDAAKAIVCWVMHSKAYFDLVGSQITDKIINVADVAVHTGSPVTLNRPVIVTDSASLFVDSGSGSAATTDYYTMGVSVGGIVLENTEEERMASQIVTGLENLVIRLQGEYAYNVGVKGFKYDIANGGANPTSSTLGTGSNWDTSRTDHRDFAGIVIKSK